MKFSLLNFSEKAGAIKSDDNKRRKSVYFAVTSIINSVLVTLSLWGGIFLLSSFDQSLLFIFILVIGFALLACALVCFVNALVRLIFQFIINRGVMSWIALAVFIASIAVGIFIALEFI